MNGLDNDLNTPIQCESRKLEQIERKLWQQNPARLSEGHSRSSVSSVHPRKFVTGTSSSSLAPCIAFRTSGVTNSWARACLIETRFEAMRARIVSGGTRPASLSNYPASDRSVGLLSPIEALLGKPNFTPTPESILRLLELPRLFRNAQCRDQDPRIFDGETLTDIFKAKRICNSCPIRAACASWAISTQDFGVWGSLTPGERRRKAKGKEVIDITEILQMEADIEKLASNTPIDSLAAEFKVTNRTIHRWRRKIQAATKSTKKVL